MTSPLPAAAGVIGWPVAHAKSPCIHRFWLGKLGLDGDYGRFPVAPEQLGAALRALPALGMRGVNVTVPHKAAALAHVDRVEPSAAAIGAINTITVEDGMLVGRNTDVEGLLEPLADVELAGRSAVLIGAGGAARAALAVLKARRAGPITLLNRTPAKAAALLAEFGLAGEALPLDAPLPRAQLLINTSTLGMAGQPALLLDLAPLPADAVVFDAVYVPLETPLLAAARARNLRTIDGLSMLIGQAATAFGLFFGTAAPRAHDAELRVLLAQ